MNPLTSTSTEGELVEVRGEDVSLANNKPESSEKKGL